MKIYYKHILLAVILLYFFLGTEYAEAQCAMCRAVLESESGQSTAEGVNNGIIYLMMFPYILIGGIAYLIYYQFFRTKKVKNT